VASASVAANAGRRSLGKNGLYLAGLTPAALLLALFFVGPALWALASSFTNRALVGLDAANPRFVGLDNYIRLFGDPDFGRVILNSVIFVIGSAIIGQFVLGLLLALLLDHAQRRGFSRPASSMRRSCSPGSTPRSLPASCGSRCSTTTTGR